MTFKEFNKWCNDRACDGHWGMNMAIACIQINKVIHKAPFWKRKKIWQEYQKVAEEIVNKN